MRGGGGGGGGADDAVLLRRAAALGGGDSDSDCGGHDEAGASGPGSGWGDAVEALLLPPPGYAVQPPAGRRAQWLGGGEGS